MQASAPKNEQATPKAGSDLNLIYTLTEADNQAGGDTLDSQMSLVDFLLDYNSIREYRKAR